jgi:uracil-DNA glycosylase
MMLRNALSEFATGWKNDLSPTWRSVLAQVNPDPLSVLSTLTFEPTEPIYPTRRHIVLPGARADAHLFRAFDGVEPAQVRCVLIGQDPYPTLSRATGRSFEQGDLTAWTDKAGAVASSLRVLLRMLVAARTGNTAVLKMRWAKFAQFVSTISLESPRELFDHLQSQGVLCLNAGLTITRYKAGGALEQTKGHIPFWKPVVGQVLRSVATRPTGQVVFLCLGRYARDLLVSERVETNAIAAGTWGKRATRVLLLHPVAPGFLNGPNPFVAVNRKLTSLGSSPISW